MPAHNCTEYLSDSAAKRATQQWPFWSTNCVSSAARYHQNESTNTKANHKTIAYTYRNAHVYSNFTAIFVTNICSI